MTLEERGKSVSGKGKSVGIGTVYRNGKGGRAETERPCCQAKRLSPTLSRAIALEPSEGFSRKVIGSELCLRRK